MLVEAYVGMKLPLVWVWANHQTPSPSPSQRVLRDTPSLAAILAFATPSVVSLLTRSVTSPPRDDTPIVEECHFWNGWIAGLFPSAVERCPKGTSTYCAAGEVHLRHSAPTSRLGAVHVTAPVSVMRASGSRHST